MSKKANDPKQILDEAEQVKYVKYRASVKKATAKGTDLMKRNADPNQELDEGDQARAKKRQIHDDKSSANVSALRNKNNDPNQELDEPEQARMNTISVLLKRSNDARKADRDEKWKLTLLMLQKIRDTEHGLFLSFSD